MRTLRLSLLVAGVALGVGAYQVQIHNLGAGTTPARSWSIVIGAWLFLVAGVVAWSRRPANRLGPLMAAAGIVLLLRQLRYSHDAFLFTVFFVVGELSYWVVAHAIFAYPSGRITDRAERALTRR